MLLLLSMRNLRPILLALTAVAAVSVAHPAKANLITNPGFEDQPSTGWTFSQGAFNGFHAQLAHSGTGYGELVPPRVGSSTIAQSVATTAGASYTISFFVAASAIIASNLSVNFVGTVFNYLFDVWYSCNSEFTFTAFY